MPWCHWWLQMKLCSRKVKRSMAHGQNVTLLSLCHRHTGHGVVSSLWCQSFENFHFFIILIYLLLIFIHQAIYQFSYIYIYKKYNGMYLNSAFFIIKYKLFFHGQINLFLIRKRTRYNHASQQHNRLSIQPSERRFEFWSPFPTNTRLINDN